MNRLNTGESVRITEDGAFFGRLATIENANPVHGSSQVWLKTADGTRVVVARHEIEEVPCPNR
jgi:hypothetical protein